jgi:RNA polymerase sigma factor (sigma-70 family)
MNDHELLQQYVAGGSEDAFRELMNRHGALVFSAAIRQVGDKHLAEEVTQIVFVLLARKASSLPVETVLPGWLWQTARFTAMRAMRSAQRREHYETEAASMKIPEQSPQENWNQISPLVNEAIGRLSEMDRNAVLLRFYETKSFSDIATRLKISEAAAQKRVARSLEKVRQFFARKGFAVTAASLGVFLSNQTATAIPESIRASLSSHVMARLGTGGKVNGLEQLSWRDLQWAKFRRLAVPAGTLLSAVLIAFSVIQKFASILPQSSRQKQITAQISNALNNDPIRTGASRPVFHSVALHVVDAITRQPLPSAALVSFDMHEPSVERNVGPDGVLSIDLPDGRFAGMLVSLASDGYRHRLKNFKPSERKEVESDPIIEMYPSSTMTGRIQDETGKPIAGAQLVLDDFRLELGLRAGARFRQSLANSVSDPEGHWSIRQLPKGNDEIWLHVIHPDFKPARVNLNPGKTVENIVIVLKQGVRISGRVIDESDEPVHASLAQPRMQGLLPFSTDTGTDGTFTIEHASPDSFRLRVIAAGYAAQMISIEPRTKTNVEVKLQKSAILRGRVVDESGNPVSEATVATASDQFGNDEWQWNMKTDKYGRFIWDSAPIGPHLYGVVAPGYALRSGIPLNAEDGEQILTVKRTRTRIFEGTVVDASSGLGIPDFEICLNPVGNMLAKGTNGFFKIEHEDHGLEESFVLSIRANGYTESFAEPRRFAQNAGKFTFRMERNVAIEGTVLDPEGEPASGALVTLTKSNPLPLVSLTEPSLTPQYMTEDIQERTDARGEFHFRDGEKASKLTISHQRGCARFEGGNWPKIINLQAWGRIEGDLKIGSSPAARKPLLLSGEAFPFSYSTNTDENGHFAFEQVPPGAVLLYRYINPHPDEPGPVGLSHEIRLQISPGATTHADFDKGGRSVTGRLVSVSPTANLDWTHDCYYLEPKPDRSNGAGEISPTRRYYFVCASDGIFQVDDVPEGMYRLVVRVSAASYGASSGLLQIVASTERAVTIDRPKSQQEMQPINLGDISVSISEPVSARDPRTAKRTFQAGAPLQ